jgi:hypothetical protein
LGFVRLLVVTRYVAPFLGRSRRTGRSRALRGGATRGCMTISVVLLIAWVVWLDRLLSWIGV